MVSMTHNNILILIISLLAVSACAPQAPKEEQDIYAALRDDNIQYADGSSDSSADVGINEASPAFVDEQLASIRFNFFKRRYAEAADLAENLVRIDPNLAEGYYWLARIRLDQSDYYQAYEMSSKGLTVIEPSDQALLRELERIQGISQMGSN